MAPTLELLLVMSLLKAYKVCIKSLISYCRTQIHLEQLQREHLLGGRWAKKATPPGLPAPACSGPREGGGPRDEPVKNWLTQPPSGCWRQPDVTLFFYFFLSGAWRRVARHLFRKKTFQKMFVTVGKPRGFPRSVRSQRIFNVHRPICNSNKNKKKLI